MTLENGEDVDGLSFEVEVISFVHEPKRIRIDPSDSHPETFDIEYKVLPETIEYCGDDGEQISDPDMADEIADNFDSEIQQVIINRNR